MVGVAGILKQRLPIKVTGVRAAHVCEDVLVSVIVKVGKGDPVTFLQMAKPACRCHVLKKLTSRIAEHPIGNQRA